MKKRKLLVTKVKNYLLLNKKTELNKIFVKGVFHELRFSMAERFFFLIKYISFSRVLTKIRFMCFRSYKTHSLYSFLNVYRMVLRENMLYGNYSGFKRSSW